MFQRSDQRCDTCKLLDMFECRQIARRNRAFRSRRRRPKIRAMATVQGADLLDVVVDGGESAKSLNRPGLHRILALIKRRNGPGGHRGQVGPAHA
jgi:hypothetical protein